MMLRSWRLTFAMQRLELWLLLGATVLLVVASLVIAWQTNEARADFLACMQQVAPGSDQCRTSSMPLNDLSLWSNFAKLSAQWMPLVLGLFLGVPVVAREIEGRTAPIAWALDPSRRRWLLQRAAPVVAVVLVAGVLIGIGGEMLTQASPFGEHPLGTGFTDYGSRLGQVPVRAIAVLSLAIAMGALVPRQLPAVLLTGGATLALFTGLTLGMGAWMATEAEPMDMDQAYQGGARIFDQAYRVDATGAVITINDYYQQHGDPENLETGVPKGITEVALGIPGDRYGTWVLRESAILGALALAIGALTLVVVQRRRPG